MKQSLLKISLPKDRPPLHAADFREMLAKAGDGSPLLPPAFFHYGADAQPLSTPNPEIRIVGGRTWVGVLSMKEESPLFDAAIGIAGRVVSKHYGQPVPLNIEAKTFSMERTAYPVTYFLRDMAIKRRLLPNSPERDTETLARQRIVNSLASTAELYGFDMPKAEQLEIVFHEIRELGMHNRTRDGKSTEFVRLVNAEVSMYLDLKGIWQVGNLPSRGYGRLIKKGSWTGRGDTE